jgi:hypothetical protein
MEKLCSRVVSTASSCVNFFSLMRLKRIFTGFIVAFITTTTITVSAQVSTPPSAGDGTAGNPYQIATLDNLYWLSQNSSQWSKNYIQTADIDASATSGWPGGAGFSPIGTSSPAFSGTYNGQNHVITNLTINRPSSLYIGLFGFVDGINPKIEKLGIVNATVKGQCCVGILVGDNNKGTIVNCYTTGSVLAACEAGGLVGDNMSNSTISYCYSTANVTGSNVDIGGLVGFQFGTVNNCYATGNVASTMWTGGLVGYFSGNISNSYSRGDVTRTSGGEVNFGGFGGYNSGATVTKCYSTGKVIYAGGTNPTDKGFVGTGSGTMTGNFWDTESSGQSTNSAGGATGKTTAEMKTQSTFTSASWDFTTVWKIDISVNSGYPSLQTLKSNQTITFGPLSPVTYGSSPFNLTGTASSGLTVSYQSSNLSVATIIDNTVTIAEAGTTTITASQAGDENYNAAISVLQTLTINKATPVVTWANPSAITYGTILSATQLNASPSVPGILTYTPVSGTTLNAGANQTLSVDFVPNDATNYNSVNGTTVLITVNKATPVVTWATPSAITYGTALSATQLNASPSVPGILTYTPASGTTLNAGANQTLSVDFVPNDATNYNSVIGTTVLITVNKATPVVTWATPSAITYGTILSATQLNASPSVPGILTYTPVSGTTLNAGANQTLCVDFVPDDATNFNSVNGTTVLITVNKATPVVTWATPSAITYGTALSATQLNASPSVPGILTYTPVSGTTLNAGANQTLSVDFVPNDAINYNSVIGTTVQITVNKATPVITWSNPADIIYGTALSSTQLNATADVPGTFAYTPAAGVVLSVGPNQSLSVLFTPDDAVDYANASKSVLINVMTITDVWDFQQNAVSVYPNPTNGILTISGLSSITNGKTVTMSISDNTGKTMMIKTLESNMKSVTIDISQYANGVYSLVLQTDKERILKRFVKQ